MRERLAQLVDPGVASRVTLGTFHSFCIRILRREATKLGYLPGFTPILVSLLVLAFTVPFCVFAAKGRLAFLFPVLGYFAIDLVCSFFANAPLGEKAIDIASRALILSLLVADVLLYFLAKWELQKEKTTR